MIQRLLPVLTDATPIAADASSPSSASSTSTNRVLALLRRTRGAVAAQLMLDQPYASQFECERAAAALRAEYSSSSTGANGASLRFSPSLTPSSGGGSGGSSSTRVVSLCQAAPVRRSLGCASQEAQKALRRAGR